LGFLVVPRSHSLTLLALSIDDHRRERPCFPLPDRVSRALADRITATIGDGVAKARA
jgi:hypothetical protein